MGEDPSSAPPLEASRFLSRGLEGRNAYERAPRDQRVRTHGTVFEVARSTTVEEVNGLFEAAAGGPLEGILGFEKRPLVSSDFVNDPRSGIVDGPATMVVDVTQV